jgi:hypothetical protein
MEVGRVGDLRIGDGSIVRLPLVGDRLYRWPNEKPSTKERLETDSASRWSAARLYGWHDQEKRLDTSRPSHGTGRVIRCEVAGAGFRDNARPSHLNSTYGPKWLRRQPLEPLLARPLSLSEGLPR